MHLNIDLLSLAYHLGVMFGARVTNWGRDREGNKQVGGVSDSWHLWERGANAIDMTTSTLDEEGKPKLRILELMANEARDKGYQAIVYKEKRYIHIEVPW
jgi:hypothetical protein